MPLIERYKIMRVYCASQECKYNDRNRCIAETISLSCHSVMTYHDGRQDFWKCKQYEMSEDSKRIFECLKAIIDKQNKEAQE